MKRPCHFPPRSPFTTHLSGSAKETELRIRSIFQWKRLRPPLWLMALVGITILLCGSLVSCQNQTPGVSLVMDVQHYDTASNYIEIPVLATSGTAQPAKGVNAINEALAQLKADYQPVLEGSAQTPGEKHCLLYPSETGRYLNLVFFREEYRTDLNTGHITSLVYDKKSGEQFTLAEALELAGQTEEELCQALAQAFDPTLQQDNPDADVCIQNQAVEGFRMGSDGQPIFYLTARTDDRDDSVQDMVSGCEDIYIWQGGSFSRYDQYNTTDPQPLVPAEECLDLAPPLWRQWYFEGGQPEGGFSSASGLSEADRTLLQALYEALHGDIAADTMDEAAPTLLESASLDGYTLAAASFRDDYSVYLVIGSYEEASGKLTDPTLVASTRGGAPHTRLFLQDGTPSLLYTLNGMSQGLLYGDSGVVQLQDGKLSWIWPVEGNIMQLGTQAQTDYFPYWADHLALMSPGGVDVFVQTNNDAVNGDGPQWVLDHNEQFYAVPEDQLTTGVYYQVRVWLEEFTRTQYNPWDSQNASAVWQIVSLTPEDGVYQERNFEGQVYYNLVARADNGQDLYLNASVLYDHGSGRVAGVSRCVMGTGAELGTADFPGLTADDASRDTLIRTCLQTCIDVPQWYYLEQLPDNSVEGAMSVDVVTPLATGETDGQYWTLFEVDLGIYYFDGAPLRLSWHGGINRTYIGLAQDKNGSYTRVLGLGDDIGYQLAPQLVGVLASSQVCLYRDGFELPVGPGKPLAFSCLDTMHMEEEKLEDYDPIYHSGDYWLRSSGQVGGGTFTALSYHDSTNGHETIYTLDTTMAELHTPRGIQVGDSRAAVLEAYPEALSGNYRGQYPQETDMLTYLPNSSHDPSQVRDLDGLGVNPPLTPAILFFFEGDTLSRITLTNPSI